MKYRFLLLWLTLVAPGLAATAQPSSWTARTAIPTPSGRNGAYSFVINNVAYVGGGYDGLTTRNDLWAYNPVTDNWTQRASLPGLTRNASSVFVINSTAYIVAGQQIVHGNATDQNDAWAYNVTTDSWTQVANLPGSVRYSPYSFAVGGKGYIGGGAVYQTSGIDTQLTDAWMFDPATGQWTAALPPPQGLALSTSFALGGYGYVAGGVDAANLPASAAFSRQVWRFDPVANTWSARADLPGGRAFAAGCTAGAYAYLADGIIRLNSVGDPVTVHDVLRYDPVADFWVTLPAAPGISGRFVPFCFALGHSLYVGCGNDDTFDFPNDLQELTNIVTGVPALTAFPTFTLAPNPAHHTVRLSGAPAGPVTLLDGLGRVVRAYPPAPATLDLTGLSAGLYLVRAGQQTRRLVVE